jgi:D-arabinose 1-dehydrogenase-like Zn-dependent alcohol dehydrogenase
LLFFSGVNFDDVMTRNGMLDNWVRSLKAPFIMGSEVAGEVIGLGKNVTELNVSFYYLSNCFQLIIDNCYFVSSWVIESCVYQNAKLGANMPCVVSSIASKFRKR